MPINHRDIRYLEALASLRLAPKERERLRGQLERILEYVEQLQAIDVEGVPPTSHVLETQNVLREDEVRPSLPPDVVLGNAPDAGHGHYRVPRFLGGSEAEAQASAETKGEREP